MKSGFHEFSLVSTFKSDQLPEFDKVREQIALEKVQTGGKRTEPPPPAGTLRGGGPAQKRGHHGQTRRVVSFQNFTTASFGRIGNTGRTLPSCKANALPHPAGDLGNRGLYKRVRKQLVHGSSTSSCTQPQGTRPAPQDSHYVLELRKAGWLWDYNLIGRGA